MQQELDAAGHDIAIVGINEAGRDEGNEQFCDGRDLPWLQDTATDDVWGEWGISYRDVVVLDAAGDTHGVFNLTNNDLGDQVAHDELWALLTQP
jgi:hypothetical protein